jgi:RNA-directed DNA polymerase
MTLAAASTTELALPVNVSLADILDWQNLSEAWRLVKANKGAPGVDEVTVARWERHWETNLHRLSAQVRSNRYCPNRPRRFKVFKRSGGYREFSILTVTDRVLQRAALNVIGPLFESVFLNGSYGYRPNRNVAQAIEQVLQLRDKGYGWVFDADIEACFESLDHDVIRGELAKVVVGGASGLIDRWMKSGTPPPTPGQPHSSTGSERRSRRGVPLGAVISPLLCNVALHPLDLALEATVWPWVRYADDFVVLTRTQAEALEAWEYVEATFVPLRLKLKPSKTWVTSFENGFKFLGVSFKGDRAEYLHTGERVIMTGRNFTILKEKPPNAYDDFWL